MTGVEISTRPVKRSGRAGKATKRTKRSKAAPAKSPALSRMVMRGVVLLSEVGIASLGDEASRERVDQQAVGSWREDVSLDEDREALRVHCSFGSSVLRCS